MPDSLKLKRADIETPALLVDLDVMDRNLETMTRFFCNRPAKLRPHFKNHRVLELASRQMDLGAIGITCARLWQAERLVSFGIRDILIANEIAGETPVARFVELSREAPVLVAVDNPKVVADMARLARDRKAEVNVLVDVDLGLKRCGAPPREPAAALARTVVESGLKFRGLMGYEGHLQPLIPGAEKERAVTEAMRALLDTRKLIESAGIAVGIVSCGGTGDYSIAGAYPGVTENQAGSYMLMDTWYSPFAPDFKVALSVLVTVISKSAGERLVVDAGCKVISGERGLPSVKGIAGLKLKALHAEHAPIEIQDSATGNAAASNVEVGDKLEIAVHYHDGTINLHRQMYGMRNGEVERIFTIEQ
jgi:D-serine deaminase-like pyridoxal phosphate-dependent protein